MAGDGKLDKLMQTIEELITCAVCQSKFNSPKILKCHHTFCRDCINGLIDANKDNCFPCPLCRVKCFYDLKKRADDFPCSTYVQDLLEIPSHNNQVTNDEKVLCNICKDNKEAVHACIDCENSKNYLCSACNNFHKQFCSDHTVIPMTDFQKSTIPAALEMKKKTKYCPQHKDHKLEFLCIQCDEQICLSCSTLSHETHKKESLATLAESVRGLIAKIEMDIKPLIENSDIEISRLESKLIKLSENAQDKEAHIKNYVKTLHERLEEREEMLLQNLQQKESDQRTKIENIKLEAETIRVRKESLLHYLQSLTKFGTTSHLVAEKQTIEGRWEQIQELKVTTDVSDENTKIVFTKDQKVEKYLTKWPLGNVEISEPLTEKGVEGKGGHANSDADNEIYEELYDDVAVPNDEGDPYASSSDDTLPARARRVGEGQTVIASMKTGIKVTGFTLTKKNEIVLVSHISKACHVYKTTKTEPTVITNNLVGPWDAAVAEDKRNGECIYITDTGDRSVKKFLKDGTFLEKLTTNLKKPHGIAVATNGDVYVCDAEDRNVVIIPPGKSPQRKLRQMGKDLLFSCPWYITITPQGEKIVSDFEHKKLFIIKHNGSISEYGAQLQAGLTDFQFQPAKSCIYSKRRCIFVVNQIANTIHVLDLEGKLLKVIPSHEIPVTRPIGLAFDSNEYLWIASHNGVVVQTTIDFAKLTRYVNVDIK